MGEYIFFLVIIDTCDVRYNSSISLLPPIVLDNFFGKNQINFLINEVYRLFRVRKPRHICKENKMFFFQILNIFLLFSFLSCLLSAPAPQLFGGGTGRRYC